ncbi:MAG: hypothetical protein FWD23_03675 [Oscillospiraceae bacterium]|nr:hypothetical protein [Oscillospiraceae bacterium]
MNKIYKTFLKINEPYAGGFLEFPERGRFYKCARAQRRHWEFAEMPAYNGGMLYPCGYARPKTAAVVPDYSYTYSSNIGEIKNKLKRAGEESYIDLLDGIFIAPAWVEPPHEVGGNGYTHSIPNYKRVIKEGLDSYLNRIKNLPGGDFKDGLTEIIEGIRIYRERALKLLKSGNAPKKLVCALEKVPFVPAENLYEALVGWNFIYYIDGCDNPGRLDAELIEYHNGENITGLFREFFMNVDINNGWSSALGPECNELTLQILKAAKGMRRPSFELRITDSTPVEIWEAALDCIESGCGQPAFYNENLYQSSLSERFLHIPKKDLLQFNGGGCTETMLAGISRVGSLDAGINIAYIFEKFLNKELDGSLDFDDFYEKIIGEIYKTASLVAGQINKLYKSRIESEAVPHPVRTLLIDDCIDNQKDFNAGGARYNWSVVNFAGVINVIDSLLAVKSLVFDKKIYTANDFLRLLEAGDGKFYAELRKCPCFGVDDEEADKLAADFAGKVFASLDKCELILGGGFLSSSIQFATYEFAGTQVGATPDGRKKGEPLCDCLGAVHGKDTAGPTALLSSAAKLHLKKALGTPVLNFRIQKQFVKNSLRPLIMGFFRQGGMQIQINCVSREEMEDALIHPEKHENLIVRIGGYSEYFNRLSDVQKHTVIERTEH